MSSADVDKAGMQEDWELPVSLLTVEWQQLAGETEALNGLRKNKTVHPHRESDLRECTALKTGSPGQDCIEWRLLSQTMKSRSMFFLNS